MSQMRLKGSANEVTGANAGERPGSALKSRVVLRHRPGVAVGELTSEVIRQAVFKFFSQGF